MNQEELRKKIKLLKALQGITYKELSEYLDIKQNSLYNYIRGQYDLSEERAYTLREIVDNLWEEK